MTKKWCLLLFVLSWFLDFPCTASACCFR